MLKVFYTDSYKLRSKAAKYYDKIIEAIKDSDVEVVTTTAGSHLSFLDNKFKKNNPNKEFQHNEAVRRAIMWADIVIVEISRPGFRLSSEVMFALNNKKPTLCMSLLEDLSTKFSDKYFYACMYNEYNIKKIIDDFIHKFKSPRIDQRFNMLLSKDDLEYIKSKSEVEGLNASEYLRNLIYKDRFSSNS